MKPQHKRTRGSGGSQGRRRRRRALIKRDGECCAKCGSTALLTVDHIKPVSEGGSNKIENLQLLCIDCNQLKAEPKYPVGSQKRLH